MIINYEIRTGVKRTGNIILVTKEELGNYFGFRSLYGFDEDTTDQIKRERTTRGLIGQKLYSDVLFLDIDNNDQLVPVVKSTLNTMGAGYDIYHTGNRGYHFHIPIEPIFRADTANRQKRFVEHYFPGVDSGIYKTSGLIRLPGTFHSKCPGKRKILLESHTGKLLVIDLTNLPAPIYLSEDLTDTDQDFEGKLDYLLSKRVNGGGRNVALYNIAFMCRQCQYNSQKTNDLLQLYNRTLVSPSVHDLEIRTIVRSTYR